MRVLLDENMDRLLKRRFDERVEVLTVDECGWKGMTNGDLLRAAEATFDVFVTMDGKLEYQKHLRAFAMGFVVLKAKSNSYQDVEPLIPNVNETLKTVQPGQVVHVAG